MTLPHGEVLSPLETADWNFDAVPDSELIACCLWEYARESDTISLAASMHWCNVRDIWNREKYKLDPKTKAADDAAAERIQRRVQAAGFDYDAFLEKFWESDLASVEIYQSICDYVIPDARAWQSIPSKPRKNLSDQVSQSYCLHPLASAMVGELEQLWNANRRELDDIRSRPRPEYDDSEDCALYQATEPMTVALADGSVTAAFTVDFARFNDREILDGLKKWLTANRPKKWQRPLRVFPSSGARGKKLIEYRVALERLGLMRLLHWYPPRKLREIWPDAWRKYGRKQDSFRREIRQVNCFFHKLFPFLPPKERPSLEERHAVWMASMQKICDAIDEQSAQS